MYEAIDHVLLPDASLGAAAGFERLGLRVSPRRRSVGLGLETRMLAIGGDPNLFYVEWFAIDAPDVAEQTAVGRWFRALAEGPPALAAVVLRVADMRAALAELNRRGLQATAEVVTDGEGRRIADFAPLSGVERAGVRLALVAYAQPLAERFARYREAGLLAHDLPVKRLDHMAAMAPGLDDTTHFWTEMLGIPLAGKVTNPIMVIHQMRVGDVNFELLGPASAESPLAKRPPGLSSVIAVEVPDPQAAVARARAAGFTLNDAAPGVLPGTRTTTIAADQLGGLSLQLLEYV
jgi:catechol 2,3-dioxygenase-like lactoylglutathione lyase family enzyme